VKNLFIVGGSMSVTSGGVNPTSTIQALALYIADSIKKRLATLFDGTGPRSQPRLVSLSLVCYRRNLAARARSGEGRLSTHLKHPGRRWAMAGMGSTGLRRALKPQEPRDIIRSKLVQEPRE